MLHECSPVTRSRRLILPSTCFCSPHRLRKLLTLVWFGILIGLSGCGSPGKGKLYPVQGKVTLDGAPLAGGQIAFHPDGEKGNKSRSVPTGAIGSDGTYKLSTDGKPGAPPGPYKVTVNTNFPGVKGTPVPIDSQYGNPTTTKLTSEVGANSSAGAYDFKVTK